VSFLLIPVLARLTIVGGVFFHHLVGHAMEHRRLKKEVLQFRQKEMHRVS
jgi:hypothetical protein